MVSIELKRNRIKAKVKVWHLVLVGGVILDNPTWLAFLFKETFL